MDNEEENAEEKFLAEKGSVGEIRYSGGVLISLTEQILFMCNAVLFSQNRRDVITCPNLL